MKDQWAPGEHANCMIPASEQRPLSRFPEVRGGLRRAGQAPLLCLSLPLSGRAVLLASRKLSDLPGKGCHLKAACPRRLTSWRQEPAPTVTSNNPHNSIQETFLKISVRPRVSSGGSRVRKGGRLGAGFPALPAGHVQHGCHKRLHPEVWRPRAV